MRSFRTRTATIISRTPRLNFPGADPLAPQGFCPYTPRFQSARNPGVPVFSEPPGENGMPWRLRMRSPFKGLIKDAKCQK